MMILSSTKYALFRSIALECLLSCLDNGACRTKIVLILTKIWPISHGLLEVESITSTTTSNRNYQSATRQSVARQSASSQSAF